MGDTDADCWWHESVVVVLFFLNLSHIASGASLTACAGAPQLIEITIAGAAVSR